MIAVGVMNDSIVNALIPRNELKNFHMMFLASSIILSFDVAVIYRSSVVCMNLGKIRILVFNPFLLLTMLRIFIKGKRIFIYNFATIEPPRGARVHFFSRFCLCGLTSVDMPQLLKASCKPFFDMPFNLMVVAI